jgi:anti-sigma factor RsiW
MKHLRPETISFYIDGELPEADKKRVESHLSECPACRETLKKLSVLDLDIKGIYRDEPLPVGFEQRFYGKLKEPRAREIRAPMLGLAWAGLGAAVILLLFVSIYGRKAAKDAGGNMADKKIDSIAKDALKYL